MVLLMKNKLRLSNKRLRAVLIPILAIVGAAVIAANFLCYKAETGSTIRKSLIVAMLQCNKCKSLMRMLPKKV